MEDWDKKSEIKLTRLIAELDLNGCLKRAKRQVTLKLNQIRAQREACYAMMLTKMLVEVLFKARKLQIAGLGQQKDSLIEQ